jgi:hypothetical protein
LGVWAIGCIFLRFNTTYTAKPPDIERRIFCQPVCYFTSHSHCITEYARRCRAGKLVLCHFVAPSTNEHKDAMLLVNVEASLSPCSGPFLILLSYLHICQYRRLRQFFHHSYNHVSLTRSHYEHCVRRCHGGDWYWRHMDR